MQLCGCWEQFCSCRAVACGCVRQSLSETKPGAAAFQLSFAWKGSTTLLWETECSPCPLRRAMSLWSPLQLLL